MKTQQKQIIEYLIENKQIGNYWASHNYILRLSERIRELEAKGWKFIKGYFSEEQPKNYIYKLIKKRKNMNFEFDEKSHRYYLDGKQMTGVTSVLSVIAKPQLISWASRMATEFIAQAIKDGKEITSKLLEDAQTAHRTKKEGAADTGTFAHSIVETLIKNAIKNTNGIIEEEVKFEENLNPEVLKMITHFINWAKVNKVKFLASEEKVYHKDLFYAGTFDFLCEIEDRKYIGDFKTSSGIYGKEYDFQVAGYRHAMEYCNPELAKNIHGAIIVRCGKKGDFETKESFDHDTDLQGFLAALKLYRIINNN